MQLSLTFSIWPNHNDKPSHTHLYLTHGSHAGEANSAVELTKWRVIHITFYDQFPPRALICIIVGVLLLFRRLKKKHYGVFGNEENCLDEEVEKWRKNKSYLAEASINYCCTYLEKGSHIRNRQNL